MDISRLPTLWRPLGPGATAALFWGLPGAPKPPVETDVWATEANFLLDHRMGGLALAAVGASAVTLPPDLRLSIRRRQALHLALTLQLEAAAPSVVAALDDAGIPSVITKGPGLARRYPSAALRTYTDLDVVVPPALYSRAREVLRGIGFHDADPEPPRPYFYTMCREASAMSREGIAIDLHHHIPPWIFARDLTFEKLHGQSKVLEFEGGGRIRVPSDEHQLVIALLHVFSHLGRPGEEPIVWRDVLTLIQCVGDDRAAKLLNEMRLGGMARYILDNLPRPVRPTLAEKLPRVIPPRLAHRLVQLMPPHLGARHISGMLYRLPLRNVPAFVFGYLFPSESFLGAHVVAERATLRRWWSGAYGEMNSAKAAFESSVRKEKEHRVEDWSMLESVAAFDPPVPEVRA